MKKKSYQLLALDLDGTLTNQKKELTQRTRAAILKAQQAGVRIALASGRPIQGVLAVAEELSLGEYGGFALAFNGGQIVSLADRRVIFEKTLPLCANEPILTLAGRLSLDCLTYEGDHLITNNAENPYARLESLANRMELVQAENLLERVRYRVPKFLCMDEPARIEKLEPAVKEMLGEQFAVFRSDPYYLEILPKGIDKAFGLKKLLELSGIPGEQTMAFGDGYNDIPLIRCAGFGVAMANAVPALKEAADYVTASNEEDGVAEALEKFSLFS